MWRYLILLGAGLFLALLIGGRDHGQVRQGLLLAPIHRPLGAPDAALADVAGLPDAAPDVAMTDFVPVAAPAPVVTPAAAAPPVAGLPVPAAAAADPAPADPAPAAAAVFSLADTPAADTAASGAGPSASALRWVSANAINVREGPGTGHAVAGRLTRGEAVTVVADAGDGWLRIRIEGDGLEGFVASRLLTDVAP